MSWTGQQMLVIVLQPLRGMVREAATSKSAAVITGNHITVFTLSHVQGISLHLSPYRTKQINIQC